jgi:hypothetical protein
MCKGECVVCLEHNNEGFIVALYAVDNNNYMFRPSGFYKFEEKKQAICYIYFGAEISDHLWRLIGKIKRRIVKSITYNYALSENSKPRKGLLTYKLEFKNTTQHPVGYSKDPETWKH